MCIDWVLRALNSVVRYFITTAIALLPTERMRDPGAGTSRMYSRSRDLPLKPRLIKNYFF